MRAFTVTTGFAANVQKHVIAQMLSDAQGHYSFVGLAAGVYQIEAQRSDRVFSRQTVALGVDESQSNIALIAGNLVLTGVVYDGATTRPVAGATVGLRVADPNLAISTVEAVTTANDGAFRFTGLRAGVYRVDGAATGFAPATAPTSVSTGPNRADVRLPAGRQVAGTVVNVAGGGLADCTGTLLNNIVWANTAPADGGRR